MDLCFFLLSLLTGFMILTYAYAYVYPYSYSYAHTPKISQNLGLKMIAMADQNEYLSSTIEQGIKVIVHEQNDSPFPNVEGYKYGVGELANIYIDQVPFRLYSEFLAQIFPLG